MTPLKLKVRALLEDELASTQHIVSAIKPVRALQNPII
jgi:hypothetical protein